VSTHSVTTRPFEPVSTLTSAEPVGGETGRYEGIPSRAERSNVHDASATAVALRDVRKVYGEGDSTVVALDGISIAFAGKSTFLHMAACLDRPTSGTVMLGDTELTRLSERRVTILRRERIGFVFQAFNLMPSLTVAQNIGLPLRLDGRRPRRSDVRDVAARVGLDGRLRHHPSQLSGGQQQRVAIARALVTRPEVVFADEPTGALDTGTGRGVLALLRELVDAEGHTVVMVTTTPPQQRTRIA
jgi:putative ABC transport system ATP-binding protein